MYALCGCALLSAVQSIPLIALPFPFMSHFRFSTAFSTHPSIHYLHILWYAILLMLCHSLFLSLFPRVP
jgi:hypothetical protein